MSVYAIRAGFEQERAAYSRHKPEKLSKDRYINLATVSYVYDLESAHTDLPNFNHLQTKSS